jgi:hypothetical protein
MGKVLTRARQRAGFGLNARKPLDGEFPPWNFPLDHGHLLGAKPRLDVITKSVPPVSVQNETGPLYGAPDSCVFWPARSRHCASSAGNDARLIATGEAASGYSMMPETAMMLLDVVLTTVLREATKRKERRP